MAHGLFALTALLTTASLGLRAQTPEETIANLRQEIADLRERLALERAKIGFGIRVNGEQLDPMAVKREVVYLAGSRLVEAKLAEIFALQEMQKQIIRGHRRLADFVVSDEEVERALALRRSHMARRDLPDDGFSISRFLFFDAEVGELCGPIAGPDAWFLARVEMRYPAPRAVDLADDYERALMREDYVRERFFAWADGVLVRARVE